MNTSVRVLFVCMGNICRSPTAEGAFRSLLAREGLSHLVEVDSAGTHAYHVGHPPDTRAQLAARTRGIELSGMRARKIVAEDFDLFDYIIPMDRANRATLEAECPREQRHKIRLLLQFAEGLNVDEVPDPYYGGPSGFERVLDMVEDGAKGLLREVRQRL